MGKYDHLKILKKTKARTRHICYKCETVIPSGEIYYKEHIQDAFLHSLHAKKYCASCYERHGVNLFTQK
jgi:hypothetical protein